ncbi:MAG: type II toxin-antitoxin system RelE/ParE family toxin [Pirellulales bacterium]
MTYTVIATERAAREIEDAAAWWAENRSVEQAERWYQGIRAAIAALAVSPEARPVAAENDSFPYEIRELHYGLSSKSTHRVIFTIVRQTVLVLTVRHAARRPLTPDDLA